MSGDPVTLEFIGRLLADIQADHRALRREVGDIRSLILASVEQVRRLDRHVTELGDRVRESRFTP